jgi:hypothetical protein
VHGGRGSRPVERESRAPRAPRPAEREHRGSHAKPVEREREHRASHAKPHAKQPASDFDFSKPYEPSASSGNKESAEAVTPSHRGRPKRQTPALLGGSSDHRKPRK